MKPYYSNEELHLLQNNTLLEYKSTEEFFKEQIFNNLDLESDAPNLEKSVQSQISPNVRNRIFGISGKYSVSQQDQQIAEQIRNIKKPRIKDKCFYPISPDITKVQDKIIKMKTQEAANSERNYFPRKKYRRQKNVNPQEQKQNPQQKQDMKFQLKEGYPAQRLRFQITDGNQKDSKNYQIRKNLSRDQIMDEILEELTTEESLSSIFKIFTRQKLSIFLKKKTVKNASTKNNNSPDQKKQQNVIQIQNFNEEIENMKIQLSDQLEFLQDTQQSFNENKSKINNESQKIQNFQYIQGMTSSCFRRFRQSTKNLETHGLLQESARRLGSEHRQRLVMQKRKSTVQSMKHYIKFLAFQRKLKTQSQTKAISFLKK